MTLVEKSDMDSTDPDVQTSLATVNNKLAFWARDRRNIGHASAMYPRGCFTSDADFNDYQVIVDDNGNKLDLKDGYNALGWWPSTQMTVNSADGKGKCLYRWVHGEGKCPTFGSRSTGYINSNSKTVLAPPKCTSNPNDDDWSCSHEKKSLDGGKSECAYDINSIIKTNDPTTISQLVTFINGIQSADTGYDAAAVKKNVNLLMNAYCSQPGYKERPDSGTLCNTWYTRYLTAAEQAEFDKTYIKGDGKVPPPAYNPVTPPADGNTPVTPAKDVTKTDSDNTMIYIGIGAGVFLFLVIIIIFVMMSR